ncbi:glycosyltransferase family 4 protein, partial [Candidatus Saccharibacteria bacterium]|nr:glycosyltransferase family 4 protein [Candidatus Saccharibacteria bacterium]NIS38360.1 glycosyltransferase family 4 protein [Candidatus Saccharibacteria bacterium]NIV03449.1 group 1 glycosyl transferase [Calditrichia bacterium]
NLYSPDDRGGAERVAELQAQGLREAGHEVVVLTSGKKLGLRDEVTSGIKV